MPSQDKVTIKIPRKLYDHLRNIIEDSGFNSVTDFIVYVMRDIASAGRTEGEDRFTREEIEQIRRRLRNLGYL
jgi:Arc/MetJ-type ribon-helix-helix transcriptional regulator